MTSPCGRLRLKLGKYGHGSALRPPLAMGSVSEAAGAVSPEPSGEAAGPGRCRGRGVAVFLTFRRGGKGHGVHHSEDPGVGERRGEAFGGRGEVRRDLSAGIRLETGDEKLHGIGYRAAGQGGCRGAKRLV